MKNTLLLSFVLFLTMTLSACAETKEEEVIENIIDIAEEYGEEMDEEAEDSLKALLESSPALEDEMKKIVEDMPDIIKVSSFYRDCLAEADTKKEAISCYEEADEMAENLAINGEDDRDFDADEEFGAWTTKEKDQILLEMDESLKMMKQMTQ